MDNGEYWLVPSRKLPPEGSKEYKEFVRTFEHGTIDEFRELCRAIGVGPRPTANGMWEKGFKRHVISPNHDETPTPKAPKKPQKEIDREELVKAVNEVIGKAQEVKGPHLYHGPGDEEQANLMLGDLHCGRRTISFNSEILAQRMGILSQAIAEIVNLHRKAYPIKKLNIHMLGDMVQGEGVLYQPLENFEFGYPGQVACMSKMLRDFLRGLLDHFSEIDVWTVSGNHGRPSVQHGTMQNWDDALYVVLATTFEGHKRVKFHLAPPIPERDYNIAEVWDWRFLMKHGAGIPIIQQVPWYGITTRALRWKQSIPEHWDVLELGHFHTLADLVFNTVHILMNATAVSDDEWPRRALGMEAETKMWFFGSHPRFPVTWRYAINLRKQSKKT